MIATPLRKKLINKVRKLYHSALPEMSVDPTTKKNDIHDEATYHGKGVQPLRNPYNILI